MSVFDKPELSQTAERSRRFRASHPGYDKRKRTGRLDRRERDRYVRPSCLGIDGETVGNRFVLLAAANEDGTFKRWIENPLGLDTADCLEFLCRLPRHFLKWGFAFSYDVNMILRPALQIRPGLAERLWANNYVCFSQWEISWINRKMFAVGGPEGRAQVWDMFPWVQTSFVRWLEEWGLATDDEIARIRDMKDQRADFALDDLEAIRGYCLSECQYLARGAGKMVEMVASKAGARLRSWYSPASVAKWDMKQRGIEIPQDDRMEALAYRAFFGGHAESSTVGPVPGPIYYADIHSAYSSALVELPCLVHGSWTYWRGSRWGVDLLPYSLVHVGWKAKHREAKWGPFPVRPRTGSLRYPTSGRGWFWGVEVAAAMARLGDAYHFQVVEGWDFDRDCDERPFSYLRGIYDERREAGKDDELDYVRKTRLNSTFGVTAEHDHKDRKAPFRCYRWAGWITAATRAKLWKAVDPAELDPAAPGVVMFATDGILSTRPLELDYGDELGQWERETYDEAFLGGQGIYWLKKDGEWSVMHSRGFELGRLSLEECQAAWAEGGRTAAIDVTLKRHVGLGLALHRRVGIIRLWGTFQSFPVRKSFDVEPRRRWLSGDPYDGRSRAPSAADHKLTERTDLEALDDATAEIVAWELGGRKGKLPLAALVELVGAVGRIFPDNEQPDYLIPE